MPRDSGDTAALEEFLSERRGSRVEVRVPERGEKRRLQELAQHNAELALSSETFVAEPCVPATSSVWQAPQRATKTVAPWWSGSSLERLTLSEPQPEVASAAAAMHAA